MQKTTIDNNSVKLSIIVPYYNASGFIEELLTSIPDRDDIEVIVIDDHSNKGIDEYKEIQSRYSNRNITFCKNKNNWKNAGTARNLGLELAKGQWVLFADADDWMIDGFYEIVSKYFDSDADIVYFNLTSQNESNNLGNRHLGYETIIKNFIRDPKEVYVWELKTQWDGPVSKMIRRKLIQDYNIHFDSVRYSNDVMFSLKTGLHAKKIAVCDKPIYCVREHNTGLTQEKGKEVHEVRVKVNLRKYMYLMKFIPYKYRKEIFKKSRLDEIKMIKDHIKFNVLGMRM